MHISLCQLIQRLKTDPSSRILTRAILEAVKALTKVAGKFVSDEVNPVAR